jgi:hypothetical protein
MLTKHLDTLFGFLNTEGLSPPIQEVRIVEIANETRIVEGRRLHVSRDGLRTADEYAARFDELISAGLPWLNVSCYGVYDGHLIVGVEIPVGSGRREMKDTPVNYSGPSAAVLDKGWDAHEVLALG